jgi:hypothetical protein
MNYIAKQLKRGFYTRADAQVEVDYLNKLMTGRRFIVGYEPRMQVGCWIIVELL